MKIIGRRERTYLNEEAGDIADDEIPRGTLGPDQGVATVDAVDNKAAVKNVIKRQKGSRGQEDKQRRTKIDG